MKSKEIIIKNILKNYRISSQALRKLGLVQEDKDDKVIRLLKDREILPKELSRIFKDYSADEPEEIPTPQEPKQLIEMAQKAEDDLLNSYQKMIEINNLTGVQKFILINHLKSLKRENPIIKSIK